MTLGADTLGVVSVFDSLFPARKAQPLGTAAALLPPYQSGQPLWSDWSTEKAITDGYKASIWVYRPICTLADAVSSVSWFVSRKASDDTWERVDGHPLEALLEEPNPYMSRRELFERMVQHLCLAGNAVLLKVGTRSQTREIWPLDVRWVKPVPNRVEWIEAYEYEDGSTKRRFPAGDVIHVMLPDPATPYWGMSPLKAASKAVDTDVEAANWNMLTLQSRLSAEGLLTFEQAMTRDQHDEIRQRIRERITGAGGDRLLVVGGSAKFTPMSSTAKDQEVTSQRELNREDLCLALGVPPILYGIGDPTYSNMQVAQRALWQQTVVPMLERFAGALQRALMPNEPNLWLRYDLTTVEALSPDMERDSRVYATLVQNQVRPEAAAELIGMGLGKDAFVEDEPEPEPFAFGLPLNEPEVDEPTVDEEELEEDAPAEQRARKASAPDRRALAAELDESADTEVPGIVREFLAALEEVRGSVPFAEIVALLGSASPTDLVRKMNFDRLYSLTPKLAVRLASVFRRAGRVSARWLAKAIGKLVEWRSDDRAKVWSEARAAAAIEQIINASERAADALVTSLAVGALAGKFSAESLVAIIRAGLGLNRQQIAKLETKAAKMLAEGASPKRVAQEISRLAQKWSVERARVLAENESIDASREAQFENARDAQARGILRRATKEWVTVEAGILVPRSEEEAEQLGELDSICCTCLPMDGVRKALDEPFEVLIGEPDPEAGTDSRGHVACRYSGTTIQVDRPGRRVHPLCRCFLSIMELEVT